MSKAEKIKAKIERLKESLPWGSCASQISMECNCKNEAYNEVLSYIDSLEEEPVSEDLEYASEKYACRFSSSKYGHDKVKDAFITGAQWQKQQDQSTIELAEDHAYLAGQEQTIDKACEWLKSYRQDTHDGTGYIAGIVDDETIEEFKKAMEE